MNGSPIVVQHALPHYRLAVFEDLKRGNEQIRIMSGTRTLDGAVSAIEASELVDLEGRLLSLGSVGLFWGCFRERFRASALVMPLNARLLDQWLLLLSRSLTSRSTYFWGHYRSRGKRGPGRLRSAMVSLSDGVFAYTESDGERFSCSQQSQIFVARNSAHEFARNCLSKEGDWRFGILVLGRISEAKRVLAALDVLQILVDSAPSLPWKLYIVGAGEARLERELHRQIACHPHVARIAVLGEVPDPAELEQTARRCAHHLVPGYAGLNVVDATCLGLVSYIADSPLHAPEWEDVEPLGLVSVLGDSKVATFASAILRQSGEIEETDLLAAALTARGVFRPSATADVLAEALRGRS